MSHLHVVIISIIEGITEFLPVSSTAHIIVVERLLHTTSPASFVIGIQMGAILAAFGISLPLLRTIRMWYMVAVAALPTLVAGYFLAPYIDVLQKNILLVAIALLVGGVVMVIWPLRSSTRSDHIQSISLRDAFMIGVGQIISFIPGVSRSAATAYTAQALGIDVRDSIPFSFVLALPVMGAATAYTLFRDITSGAYHLYDGTSLVLGMLLSGIVAWVVMRWFITFVRTHSWVWFGWYRIALALVIVAVVLY